MIAIVNYDVGNLGSIHNMLKKIGANAVITSDPIEIQTARKLILPGVGAFDHGMKQLKKFGLVSLLNDEVMEKKKPLLGICLGAQLCTQGSEEGEGSFGLKWFNATTVRFNFSGQNPTPKIPHIGWSNVTPVKDYPLLQGIQDDPRYYFTHSYHFHAMDASEVIANAHYGYDFPAILKKGNVVGVQFHPEKSHRFGMQLLKNFVELI